jgi:hypothetical protein
LIVHGRAAPGIPIQQITQAVKARAPVLRARFSEVSV